MWQPQGFYNQYLLRAPVILSGEGSVRGLFNYPTSRTAVICGASFSYKEDFEAAFPKQTICFFTRSWSGEPDMDSLFGTIKELEKFAPDTIIAVGGGSIIDGCKLCRLFYEFPYYKQGETRLSGELFKTRFIVVPTTPGSGAEVSSAAVFVDNKNHRKDMIVHHELQPEVVVYDERYIRQIPIKLLVASMLDAMAHIVEGYVSNINNSITDIMAETGASIICDELRKIIEKELCAVDYKRLQYAGYIGGVVQNHCIVGAAHALAHQLTGEGYSHSEAVALLLPSVIEMNTHDSKTSEKYKQIFSKCGYEDTYDFLQFLRELNKVSGIGDRREELVALLTELSTDEFFSNNVKNDKAGRGNPIAITNEYIERLIERV